MVIPALSRLTLALVVTPMPPLLMDVFPSVDLAPAAGTEEMASLDFGRECSVVSRACFYVLNTSGYAWH